MSILLTYNIGSGGAIENDQSNIRHEDVEQMGDVEKG